MGAFVAKNWKDKKEHLLHGEVPNIASKLASAGGAAGELGPAVGADQVARVALQREAGVKKMQYGQRG